MNLKELKYYLKEKEQPPFRIKQIIKAIYKEGHSSFSNITVLSKELRADLDRDIEILSFELGKINVSRNKKAHKALLRLMDEEVIETVLIKQADGNFSSCVSSQVGCTLGCRFCATGAIGFKRNLSAEEISDQVLFWKQYLVDKKISGRVSHVVYMGMGEPFMNYEEVKKSLKQILDKDLFDLSARHVSVSTSGVANMLTVFAKDFPQLNLAISLVTANEKTRMKLMPISKKFSLDQLADSLEEYFKITKRKVFIEYILLNDVNDREEDAEKLVEFVKKSSHPELLHVNLIRYNTTSSFFSPSKREQSEKFKDYLEKYWVSVTIRRSLGQEINGACGQLAGEK